MLTSFQVSVSARSPSRRAVFLKECFSRRRGAIADLSPAKRDPHANLLPPLAESRTISLQVAIAVAEQAAREGLAGCLAKDDIAAAVKSMMWEPIYSTYQRLPPI
jgi:malic enzyme